MAPTASAKRPRLVSFRQCSAILNSRDFGDNLEEVAPPSAFRDTRYTECKFGASAESLGGPFKEFKKGEIGVECLAVAIQNLSREVAAPEGGCYRLATESVLFITGHPPKRLLEKMEKGYKRRGWPRGFSRTHLRHVGNDAEYGYAGGKGFGYLQVMNVTLTVETDELRDVPRLLKEAASSL